MSLTYLCIGRCANSYQMLSVHEHVQQKIAFQFLTCLHVFPTQNQGGFAHRVGKTLIKQTSQSRQSITFILIVLVNFTFFSFFAFSAPLYFSYSYMYR